MRGTTFLAVLVIVLGVSLVIAGMGGRAREVITVLRK